MGTDKRFCTPVLFTSERPHPNRHMWMGPPQSPSKTPVKDQIPKVLKAADEEEPVSTSATSKKAANTSEEQGTWLFVVNATLAYEPSYSVPFLPFFSSFFLPSLCRYS